MLILNLLLTNIMNYIKNLCISTFIIATAMVFAQSKYPADTLLTSKNVSLIKKIGILPIAGFQRISYNLNSTNCQFHPSCSNYGADAIKQFGLLLGSLMASERITRCNPAALESHLKSRCEISRQTLQLIDPVILSNETKKNKSPIMAATLSAIIPGGGRMYTGRWFDGFMGLTRFVFYSSLAAYAYQKDMDILLGISSGMSIIVYGGEIYGSYRTAKYY